MKELPVRASAHFIHDRGLKIDEDRARNMLACTCFREESVERVVSSTDGLVTWHLAIRLNAMFETEQLPTCVADLNTSLAQVDADDLAHRWVFFLSDSDLKGCPV